MGNGQYFDPETVRFLTRGNQRNVVSNPYVPWKGDSTQALVSPLLLLALLYTRRKNRNKFDTLLVVLVLLSAVGLSLSAYTPAQAEALPAGSGSGVDAPSMPMGYASTAEAGSLSGVATGNPGGAVESPTAKNLCGAENTSPVYTFEDFFVDLGYFFMGISAEIGLATVGLISPQLRDFYSPDTSEPDAMLIGRIVFNIVEAFVGVYMMQSGLAIGGGGAIVECLTGVGCALAPATIAAGATEIAIGGAVTYIGLQRVGINAFILYSKISARSMEAGSNNQSTNREIWKITPEKASKVMHHGRFGDFYKNPSDGLWWSKDIAGHGKSAWKVFKETSKGLEWYKDADIYGDFIVGKHKGPTGLFIPWSELSGK